MVEFLYSCVEAFGARMSDESVDPVKVFRSEMFRMVAVVVPSPLARTERGLKSEGAARDNTNVKRSKMNSTINDEHKVT